MYLAWHFFSFSHIFLVCKTCGGRFWDALQHPLDLQYNLPCWPHPISSHQAIILWRWTPACSSCPWSLNNFFVHNWAVSSRHWGALSSPLRGSQTSFHGKLGGFVTCWGTVFPLKNFGVGNNWECFDQYKWRSQYQCEFLVSFHPMITEVASGGSCSRWWSAVLHNGVWSICYASKWHSLLPNLF